MITPIEAARERILEARARAATQHDSALVKLLDDALRVLSDEVLLTTTEVAQLLGIRSVNTVKALVRAGRIEARKVGSHYRIPLKEVERLRRDATIEGLNASSRLHADLDSLGLDEGLTAEELRALAASRPGTLPWKRPGITTNDETDGTQQHIS